MIKKLKNNPILLHQIRNAKWPSMRTAVWIAAGLMVSGLALTISAYAISPDGEKVWVILAPIIILVIGVILLVFSSPLTVVVTVTTIIHAIESETHQMIRLSQVPDRDIADGYLAGVIFRLRSLWMIVAGLILPLLAALTHINVVVTFSWIGLMGTPSGIIPKPSEIILEQAGIALIVILCFVILFAAWNWLAITLGVWMAFRHRQRGKALVWALVSLLVLMASSYALYAIMPLGYSDLLPILASTGVSIVLGWLAYRQAVKCVRGTLE